MLKNILLQKGVNELNNTQLKETQGGHYTGNLQYTCWDKTGALYDSTIDASYPDAGIHCTPNAEVTASAITKFTA
ncbi:hypothetical protein MHM83_15915 [Tenacibaculum sp. Mcav3-52]|uniref:Uncharacterized protein n=2 Tax=Tenacibaculum TaxID=104267 RepID=A0AAE9MJM6_9FLAO|nr:MULTISPECIES: hypothetical protein [Tenacibaculum]AZJ31379.1 hypothetical protein D6200_01855 [Tenacibaculum mesophilum]MCG7503354.1 hypothetical protein [Tenacibaculum sp. Mcav3-52]QFS29427.1 hypothetical protein F9Y86_13850 [Tenacibaculum mesophilum]UTD14051.1 hypothetical protein HER15_00555 [Tenacibaculum mesophilum]SHF96856.1 hypothetical protein SAMN05444344_2220 [Tenacibaculum mesophilum]